jgi:O-antigen/teichoic acid export membrane protein
MPQPRGDQGLDARPVSRSAGFRLTSDLVGRGLHFALILAAQRLLGPSAYGHFTFAVAAGFVLASITDLGLPLIVTRRIAREPAEAARVAGAALALKLAVAAPAVVVLAATASTRPPGVRLASALVGLAAIGMSFVEFIGYVLRGLRRVDQETILLLMLRVAPVVCGAWALWAGRGLLGFAAAYLAGTAVALAAGAGWLCWRHVTPRLRLDRASRDGMLREALPLGGATVLSVAHTRTGVFVLDVVAGPAAVGLYGVAQKLTEPLALIPAALMAAAFPIVSRTGAGAGSGSRFRAWIVTRLAGGGGLVALGGLAFGPWIVGVLYPDEFSGAAPALQILAVAALPVFVNHGLTHFLVADGRTRLNFWFNAIVFPSNLVLCLWLAPRFGIGGVASALLASELLLLALCVAALRRAGRRERRA